MAIVHTDELKTLEINCNLFRPMVEPCRLMVAGSGAATYVKSISMGLIKRPRDESNGIIEPNS